MSDERFLTVAEACQRLGIARSTLDALVRQHHVRRYRRPGRGTRTYYRAADLDGLTRFEPAHAEPRPGIIGRVRAWLSRGGPREHKAS